MRKIDCIFPLGITNFKTQLKLSLCHNLSGEIELKVNCKNSPTRPALKRCVSNLDAVVLRPFFELLKWPNLY